MWAIQDVSSWDRVHEEIRGKRPKWWTVDGQGAWWLRKEPLPSRPFELATEVFTLGLARRVGLAAPAASLAVWSGDNGQKRGLVVRKFDHQSHEQLASGRELLSGASSNYDPTNHAHHTCDAVRAVLETYDEGTGLLLAPFAKMLLFDAWVGNGDRHQENWSLFFGRRGERPRLAPIYDVAACLGAELQREHPLLRTDGPQEARLQRYIANCPSGFGRGGSAKLLKMVEVVAEIRDWPELSNGAPTWLESFSTALNDYVDPMVESAPDEWLPSPRRNLVQELLRSRLERLQCQL